MSRTTSQIGGGHKYKAQTQKRQANRANHQRGKYLQRNNAQGKKRALSTRRQDRSSRSALIPVRNPQTNNACWANYIYFDGRTKAIGYKGHARPIVGFRNSVLGNYKRITHGEMGTCLRHKQLTTQWGDNHSMHHTPKAQRVLL